MTEKQFTTKNPEIQSNAGPIDAVALRPPKLSRVVFVLAIVGSGFAWAEDELTLDEAVAIALRADDPSITRLEANAAALEERAISDSQLPEPQFRVGLMNFPTGSWDFTQEPMTQAQIGFRQKFPRGQTLAINRESKKAEASEQRAAGRLQEIQIAYDTRSTWLELYFWLGARQIATESRKVILELVDVIGASFATGVRSNQDLLRAELELSLVDDRLIEVDRQIEVLRAELQRFIGEVPASRPLPSEFPELPSLSTRLVVQERLITHPTMEIQDARIDVKDREIDLALQQYKLGWSLDVGYGARSGGRENLSSAMIVMDIPLFKKNRQDRRLAAARKKQAAARLERDATLLELQRLLNRAYVDWVRLGERIELMEGIVLNRARANANAALDSYQNGIVDFTELIRSRLTTLETELQLRRLKVDRAKAQAGLLFLAQEAQS